VSSTLCRCSFYARSIASMSASPPPLIARQLHLNARAFSTTASSPSAPSTLLQYSKCNFLFTI
jgi:hypothetical protein